MSNNKVLWGGAVIVIAFIGWIAMSRSSANSGPGELDSFASCLKDKGTIFYGAFWCPHCANQKKLFGKSAKLLPYTECSTPDSQGVLQVCKDANITNYPTWDFLPIAPATSTKRLTGEIALETLAKESDCELPTSSTTQ